MLKSFGTSNSTPELVFTSSLARLKTLALEYRQNHVSAVSSIFWHLSLLFISNAVIRNRSDPSWRFNLMLCIYAYIDLARSFRVAEGLLRAILFMAVSLEAISHKEAEGMIRALPGDGQSGGTAEGPMYKKSRHIVDLDCAVIDQSRAQVIDLAEKLDDALLFDAFVEDD